MALIKFGSIITDSRGSIGGHTFKWGHYGMLMERRPLPPKQNTAKQSVIRARLSTLSKSWWSELSSTERDDWRTLAAANPLPNRWGDEFPLTGLAFYLRVNQRLLAAGFTATTTAPADQTVTACTSATLTVTAPSTASLAFVPTTVPTGHKLVLRVTPQLSPGLTDASHKHRLCSTFAASTTSPQNVYSALSALIGTLHTGRQIFALVSMLNGDNGAESPPIATAAIVA